MFKKINKDKAGLFIYLIILFLLSGKAFSSEVIVYGKVSDQEGRNISEAIVKFISQSGDMINSTYTNDNGDYSICLTINKTGIEDESSFPEKIKLYQNSPNPFRPGTCIPFELPEPANVKIMIYNTLGQKISTIADQYFPEGYSNVSWNGVDRSGKPLPAGIYIYRLESQGKIISGKMLLQDGGSRVSMANTSGPFQKPLLKTQKALIQKTFTICAEKEGYFPTIKDDFVVTSEDISIEKNIVLEDCGLDSFALFASIDGNPKGLWVFDANTLEKIDSLEMDWVPFSFEFSADYSMWYSTLNTKSIIAIDAKTKEISMQVSTRNFDLILGRQKRYIITYYGSDFIQFYDTQTFDLIYEDSLGLGLEGIRKMVASPTEDKVYAFHISEQGTGIMVYNTHDYQIEQVIKLTNDEVRSGGMSPADLDVSPDGNYLFATVFNWSDPNAPGWYGSFHAIDLTTNQVITEHLCGKYSQMGVSPDGKYVYVSDPAGYLYELIPTNHILRYDINSREMELFINGPSDIDLVPLRDDYIYFITDQIVIAPDNRTMFITLGGAVKTADGKDIHMAKIDTYTKKILDYYVLPRDHRGYITSDIRRLRSGKYLP